MRTPVLVRAIRSRVSVLIFLAAVLLGAGACSFDPASIPIPGTTVSGPTYRVGIEFENALNLPARAKVLANGALVGNLRSVSVVDPSSGRNGYVLADVEIKNSVQLPTTTSAQLRQATILGDVYIALLTPPAGFDDIIEHNGTIPLGRTKPALQIEDAMSGMATFINGGAIHQFQDIVNRMNSAMPVDPNETARISAVVGTDITDVGANLAQVDVFLDAIHADAQAVLDNAEPLSELLTDTGVEHTISAIRSLVDMLGVIGAIGPIAHALAWLSPLLTAGDAAAKSFVPLLFTGRPLDLHAPSNLNRMVALIRDKVIPFVEHGPKVNIVAVDADTTPASRVSTGDQVDRILATLRMIGAVR